LKAEGREGGREGGRAKRVKRGRREGGRGGGREGGGDVPLLTTFFQDEPLQRDTGTQACVYDNHINFHPSSSPSLPPSLTLGQAFPDPALAEGTTNEPV